MTLTQTSAHDRLDRSKPNGIYDTKKECCGTCRFWQPGIPVDRNTSKILDKTPGSLSPDDLSIGHGACRRRPPVIVDALARVIAAPPKYDRQIDVEDALDATATADASRFPGTFPTAWCGEFEWIDRLKPTEMPL